MSYAQTLPGYQTVFGGAHSAEVTALEKEANEFFSLHGMSAMKPVPGESATTYQRRVLDSATPFSPEYSKVRAHTLHESVLAPVWKGVIQDGTRDFMRPVGPERIVESRDDSGRTVRRFFGDPANTWAPFQQPLRVISAWNPEGRGRGSKSHTATHAEVQINGETRMVPLSSL